MKATTYSILAALVLAGCGPASEFDGQFSGEGSLSFTVGVETSNQPSFGPRDAVLDGTVITATWRDCPVRFQLQGRSAWLYEDVRCAEDELMLEVRDGSLSAREDGLQMVLQGAFRQQGADETFGVFKADERWLREGGP